MRKIFVRAFILWLPLVVALTGVFGFAFTAVQQNYRQSMNDPQIAMAEDAAASLSRDYNPEKVIPSGGVPVDIATSLSPWIAIFDDSGTVVDSYAGLDNSGLRLPEGLFDTSTWQPLKKYVAPTGPETRVTWQPRPGVRQAIVLVQFQTPHGVGYVAAGRSMRLVEERIINLTQLGAVAWSTTVLAVFATIFIVLSLGWL